MPFVVGALAILIAAVVIARVLHNGGETPAGARAAMRAGCGPVTRMFADHDSGGWVTVAAPVSSLLPDAHGASTHQRFILKCPRETILVENNVDVGTRAPVRVGERIGVHGQYIWNNLGGLVHDTHRATSTNNPDGWIYVAGRVFQ